MEGGRIRSRSAKPYLAGQGSDPEGKKPLEKPPENPPETKF